MATFDKNRVIRGTFGKVWLDGERMANVKSFEAKAAMDYEDMDINGILGQQKRYMGYKVSGTMTLYKFDSAIAKKYKDGIATGDLPALSIVASLEDPQSYGAERVALYDVQPDELTLCKFENKGMVEEELTFTAGSFKYLDVID